MDVEDWDRTCVDGFMQWDDIGIIDPDRRYGLNPIEPADLGMMEENGSESVCPEAETPSGTSSATVSTSANSPDSQLPPSNRSFTDSSEWSPSQTEVSTPNGLNGSSPSLSLTGEQMIMPWYWPNPALQPAPSLAHQPPQPLSWECPKCNRSFKKKSGLTTHAKHCEGMGSTCNQKFVRRQKRGWATAAEGGSGPAKPQAATKAVTVPEVRQAAKAPYQLGQAASSAPPDLWAMPPESFGGHPAMAPPPPSMMGLGWPGIEMPSLFFLVDPSIPQHVPQSLEEMTDITMAHMNYISLVYNPGPGPGDFPPPGPVPSDFPPPPTALFL